MNATVGFASAHHGEIIQGVFRDRDGGLHRGLVTLPFKPRYAIARVRRKPNSRLETTMAGKTKTRSAVTLFCRKAKVSANDVEITLASNIPEGYGLGSSTADIVATLRAVSQFFNAPMKPREIFELCVQAETASDGIMFNRRARLVCQREGKVLQRFEASLPRFSLLSFNCAPNLPVDTLAHPPARYEESEIDEFSELRDLLCEAIRENDPQLLGIVATRSARINQRHLPQPHFDAILDIIRTSQALGLQVAHSGRMMGIMLPQNFETARRKLRRITGQLAELMLPSEYYPAGSLY